MSTVSSSAISDEQVAVLLRRTLKPPISGVVSHRSRWPVLSAPHGGAKRP